MYGDLCTLLCGCTTLATEEQIGCMIDYLYLYSVCSLRATRVGELDLPP